MLTQGRSLRLLIYKLKSIPPGCSFNIIGFGSSHTSLFRESVSYNQENLEYAIRHAESLQADLGGTELLSPLKHIFSQRLLPGLPRQIFVLTDGSVSNTQLCIDEVARNSECFPLYKLYLKLSIDWYTKLVLVERYLTFAHITGALCILQEVLRKSSVQSNGLYGSSEDMQYLLYF